MARSVGRLPLGSAGIQYFQSFLFFSFSFSFGDFGFAHKGLVVTSGDGCCRRAELASFDFLLYRFFLFVAHRV